MIVAIWAGVSHLAPAGVDGAYLASELTAGDPYDFDQPRPLVQLEIGLPAEIPPNSADRLFRKSPRTRASTNLRWDSPRQREEAGMTILRAKVGLF